MATAEQLSDPRQRAEAIAGEQKRNLGYGLYKALQQHGGWWVNPKGWQPYRGVMQLFGPWTATEGPWKTMQIENQKPYQQQCLADQRWVFRTHQDQYSCGEVGCQVRKQKEDQHVPADTRRRVRANPEPLY